MKKTLVQHLADTRVFYWSCSTSFVYLKSEELLFKSKVAEGAD